MRRREFLISSCALCAAQAGGPGPSFGQESTEFVCATMDASEDDEFEIDLQGGTGDDLFTIDTGAPGGPFVIQPYGLAAKKNKWRKSDGRTPNTQLITLGVHYVNASKADKDLVEEGARAWLTGGIEKLFDFEFGVAKSEAQISIKFDQGVNDSLIGRSSQPAARSGFSMRIQDRKPWVVTHEFGHALCLKHEHQHPEAPIKWDEKAVIAELRKQGISEDAVRSNIFKRLSKDLICAASPGFDEESVMLYAIPARWTNQTFTSRTNSAPSASDIACVLGVYDA